MTSHWASGGWQDDGTYLVANYTYFPEIVAKLEAGGMVWLQDYDFGGCFIGDDHYCTQFTFTAGADVMAKLIL